MTTTAAVPALRQSVQAQMACETGYSLVHIQGLKPPDTLESERGTEVHDVLAKYAAHCAKEHVPADFQYLEALAYDKGQEAAEILETCRENIEIDWQNFFAAEIHVGLDRNWHPTHAYDHDGNRVEMSDIWAMDPSGLEPEVSAILDVIYLYPGGQLARIPDYKTHPRAFAADTFQGKEYALCVFMHLPSVQQVDFDLKFVRYANLKTSQSYFRSDVPRLMEDVKRYRERQLQIHAKAAAGQALSVHPGAHCQYCPAILDFSCPVARLNPHMNLSPEERLKFRLWYDVANRVNNKVMKEFVDGTEAIIHSHDENGKAYTFGPVLKDKTVYPLFELHDGETLAEMFDRIMENPAYLLEVMPIVAAVAEWAYARPEDLTAKRGGTPWQLKLRIGSTELASPLKAKFRELIHNAIRDHAVITPTTEVRITRDAEVDDGQGEEHREFGEDAA